MKTLHLSIIVILIIVYGLCVSFSTQYVYSIPYQSPEDLYKGSDIVLYGKVIAKDIPFRYSANVNISVYN